MKFNLAVRTLTISLLGATLLWAGDPWKEKPYTEWTEKDVNKVLLKSPWVRKILIGGTRPLESGPVGKPINTSGLTKGQAENEAVYRKGSGPTSQNPVTEGRPESLPPNARARQAQALEPRSELTVRWFSSRTIEEGLIRNWQLQLDSLPQPENVGEIRHRQSPESAEDPEYVERQTGVAGRKRDGLQQNIERMQSRLARPRSYYEIVVNPVFLSQSTRRNLEEVSYLQSRESKKKVPLAHIEVAGRSVVFYFPREIEGRPTIGSGEKKVRFYTKIGSQEIKVDFHILKMIRDGNPDL